MKSTIYLLTFLFYTDGPKAIDSNITSMAMINIEEDLARTPSSSGGKDLEIFEHLRLADHGLDYSLFSMAIAGFRQFEDQGLLHKSVLSIVDFQKPSDEQRMWVIDVENQELLLRTLVAHGRNSGERYASKFSNEKNSYMSSLGFYLTDNTYNGKHGLSLKLRGLETGINDKAMDRAIVIHGADYVSTAFAQQHGRVGRSLGCPALPTVIAKDIIPVIAAGSCLFIYASDDQYDQSSAFARSTNDSTK